LIKKMKSKDLKEGFNSSDLIGIERRVMIGKRVLIVR